MGKRLQLTMAAFVSAPLLAIPTLGLPAGNAVGAAMGAPAVAAGSAVGGASLQVSSTSANADQVVYSATFQTVHRLIAGKSNITLSLPPNAAVAPGDCVVVTDDATESSGCNSPTVSGRDVTVTSPDGAAAGDLVSVMLPGVTNPSGSGLRTVLVSTSADTAVVPLHFVLAPTTAVTDAALQLSSGSAQASRVTYSVTFRAPDRFINSQNQKPTITLVAPAGTVFPPYSCGSYEFIDDTRSSTGGCGPTPQLSRGGATVTVSPSSTTGAGDLLTLVIRGVVNSAKAGLHTVVLSTSADPRPVPLSYTLAPAQSVSHPFLQMSSYARSATGVTWSVGFSSPGRLAGFSDPTGDSAVTIVAPAGTRFPASTPCDNAYLFVDPIDGIDHCAVAEVSGGGSKVVIEPQMATTPGAVMAFVISDVTNPPGAGALQVWTTSDPAPVSIATSGPTIPAPAVQLDTTSARGTMAAYAATFRLTSAFNGANCLSNPSKLAFSGPAGTVFPAAGYTFYDLANGTDAGAGACVPQGTPYTPGDMVPLAPGIATGAVKVSPGDYFAVVATSVINAGTAGSYHLEVSASTGAAVDPGYVLTPPTKVASPVLQVLSNVAGATEVHYAVTFRAINGLLPDNSTFTLSLPGAAWGPGSGDNDGWTVFDDTTGLAGGGSASYAGKPASPNQTDNPGTAVVTPTTGNGFRAAPGDIVTIATDGTVNPSGPGSHNLTFSTSGDPAPVAVPLALRAPVALRLKVLNLSSHQAGAKGAIYALTFVSNGGLTPDWSAVSMAFPGAVWPPSVGDNDGFAMYDDTTDLDAGASGTISGKESSQPAGGTALITPGTGVGFYAVSGDVVTVLAKPTVNPSGAGGHTVAFSTSADPLPTKVTALLR